MTYYDPHPSHVLMADSMFAEREQLAVSLLTESDYVRGWDIAEKLVSKYTRREVYALSKWMGTMGLQDRTLVELTALLVDRLARLTVQPDPIIGQVPTVEKLANPASVLPTSDIHGEENQYGRA